MASITSHFIILCYALLLSTSLAKTPPRPKSLVLPITKDPSTNQYITRIQQRTPLTTVSLTVNLGGKFLWTNCETGYTSSTIRPGGCGTPECRLAKAFKECESCPRTPLGGPGCSNASTCWTFVANLLIPVSVAGQLASDVFSVNSTDGKSPSTVFSVPEYLFYCGSNDIMENLAQGVTGMAGLGRTQISIPFQLAKAFRFQKKFTLCLSPSKGFVLVGQGQYSLPPLSDVSTSLTYTPLLRDQYLSPEDYYIGIKSIKINEKQVPINATLLSLSKEGHGGTALSTLDPYTVLESSIHNAVISAFVSGLPKATRVAPVAPFAACFRSSSIGSSPEGPVVPPIDLVFDEEEKVFWRIYGANSMVQVNKDVMCLAFVDAAVFTYSFNPSIQIGGHQMEDNLLEFDDQNSRFGFSSSLLFRQTKCANLKYTSN